MRGIRGKAGTDPGEGCRRGGGGLGEWRQGGGRREVELGNSKPPVFLEKTLCFWRWFYWEIPEDQKIILHVLCKPTDTAWLTSFPRACCSWSNERWTVFQLWHGWRAHMLLQHRQTLASTKHITDCACIMDIVYINLRKHDWMFMITPIRNRLINRCCLNTSVHYTREDQSTQNKWWSLYETVVLL